ncbi:MAG: hypothetical protein JF614_31235 [Acidobacteria bacterium]|nr:hypothetical protein [Acidobacteriota bacterium]
MRPQPGRQKLGLFAVAFDGAGRELLSALAGRPGVSQASVHCCHVVEEEEGRLAWFSRAPGASWRRPDWAASATRFETGLEAAVRTMLDVERWQTPGGGLDLLDLVLVSPGFAPDSGVALPKETLAALKHLRRRFRRIGRILLLADGTYETSGEAAPPGLVQPLPYADGSDGGIFDVILLLDRINTEGMAVNDAGEARAQAAGILYHLTLGEMAPVLFARIQSEQARLGQGGRYLSLGFTEWRLTSQMGIEATSGALYRDMVRRFLAALSAPPEAWTEPSDAWLEEVSPEILAEPPASGPPPAEDLLGKLAACEEKSHETLRSALRGMGWRLEKLEPLLKRRISALKQLEAQTALKLAHFMDDTFARWYAEKQTGRIKQPQPQVFFEEELDQTRAAAFAVACLACLIAAGVAIFSDSKIPASIVAGAAGLGAVMVYLKGFKRKISRLGPVIPLRNWMPELNFRRGQSWLARELVRRHEKALSSWQETQKALRAEIAVPVDSIPVLFPFSPEVTQALLEEKSVSAAESLHRFWESETAALRAAVGRPGASLSDLLRESARKSCLLLADLEWSDVFRVISGSGGPDASSWREALEKARASALPWMPVPGTSLQTFLALPSGLSADLRSALGHQYPDQKVIEEIEGEAILIFQLTQGYRVTGG